MCLFFAFEDPDGFFITLTVNLVIGWIGFFVNVFFSVKFMSKPNVPHRVDIGNQECALTIGRL